MSYIVKTVQAVQAHGGTVPTYSKPNKRGQTVRTVRPMTPSYGATV